jgi:hypothetical protein
MQGKVHDYLGMNLDFTHLGKVCVNMMEYICMVLNDVPDNMKGKAATPAANHLFIVNN